MISWASVPGEDKNMSKETGGPAFPFAATDTSNEQMQAQGMTLRDYFAAKAMASILSQPEWEEMPSEHVAMWAYENADAMLRARGTD